MRALPVLAHDLLMTDGTIHFVLDGGAGSNPGRRPAVWHCTQAIRACRDPASSVGLTYKDAVFPALTGLSAGLPWQLRQSPLDMPSV
jgi:hypothetical protein